MTPQVESACATAPRAGDASVAGAGQYSHTLGKVATTMQETGDAYVAGAGQYSHTLGRVSMTIQERGDMEKKMGSRRGRQWHPGRVIHILRC